MKKAFNLLLLAAILFALMRPSMAGQAVGQAQENANEARANQLLQAMSVEEKVGQVFLVTFSGRSVEAGSQIQKLISENHVGGVVLTRQDGNFTGPENTVAALQQLIIDLQTANHGAAFASNYGQTYSPLLIGISQEGDLYPGDQVLNGLTVLPNEMTLGATWDIDNARTVGSILGAELDALGINLLIGPSLDVLETVSSADNDELGTGTFGGSPWWVGKMGQAYIKGIHDGSDDRVAVIASHFPGAGSSDRLAEEEIATVRKSLDQLRQVDLAPFFAVTSAEQDASHIADGLLMSHIRYQGIQGNILPTTRPISFDSLAIDEFMSMTEFSSWRDNGGVLVSDDLSNPAVRELFDPLKAGYDARQVARMSLMAGNDLLYLGNIIATGDVDSYTTVVRTLNYFVQKYGEDVAFRTRVDQAALKVLMLKMKLYPNFGTNYVIPSANQLASLGTRENQIPPIARAAVTLVSPAEADLKSVLPRPPDRNDRIVILSNSITYAQCEECVTQTIFPAESLLNSLIHLYGSGSGDPINGANLKAYSFENVRLLLEQAEGSQEVQVSLNSATWIIFAFTDPDFTETEATTFKRLFEQRQDLVRNKKIIGMAFGAPYYLDSTDISKFSAYYAFYSKIPEFYDVAARVLLQELTPTGKLPVSVPGIGYDLSSITSPDPEQIIPLIIEAPVSAATAINTPPTGYSQPLLYKAGDTIPVKAGVILDHNGNPVPDGTLVRFVVDTRSTSGTVEQLEATTVDGMARVMYVIPSIGSLELRVTADPAQRSQILRLDITAAGGVVTSYEPTPQVEETVVSTPTEMPTPTPQPAIVQTHSEGKLAVSDWLLTNLLIFGFCYLFYLLSHRELSVKWTFLTVLLTGLGGNLAYLYLAVGIPATKTPISEKGTVYILLVVGLGMIIGLGIGLAWYIIGRRGKRSAQKRNN